MKIAKLFFLALMLLAPGGLRAESLTLSCHVASSEGVHNDLVVEIGNGRVRYGASGESLVDAQSVKALSVGGSEISFTQSFPSTNTMMDWTIDRASGAIMIKYINTRNSKPFLTKRGACR